MSIATLFSHEARQRRAAERMLYDVLAKNGYPETALLLENGLLKDPHTASYRLAFATWESEERYLAIATKDGNSWRITLQIGDAAPQLLQ